MRVLVIILALVSLGLMACSGGGAGGPTVAPTWTPMPVVAEPIVEPTAVPTATPQIDSTAFLDRAQAVITEQQNIMTDLAAEATAAGQESSLAEMGSHGPAFRALQGQWLATGDSMDELRPEPPEMQEFFALWVQAYSQGAQALDSIAEGAETLDIGLINDATIHLGQATALFDKAAAALPSTGN